MDTSKGEWGSFTFNSQVEKEIPVALHLLCKVQVFPLKPPLPGDCSRHRSLLLLLMGSLLATSSNDGEGRQKNNSSSKFLKKAKRECHIITVQGQFRGNLTVPFLFSVLNNIMISSVAHRHEHFVCGYCGNPS